jgi:hypothetical protein
MMRPALVAVLVLCSAAAGRAQAEGAERLAKSYVDAVRRVNEAQ